MNLIVDLGNTRVKLAVLDTDSNILFTVRKPKRYAMYQVNQLMKQYNFQHAILSATSEASDALMNRLGDITGFKVLDATLPIPIQIRYSTPETLGKDRLAAAVAAYRRYPGQHTLVIDMGTCITMDLVTSEGIFIGGNISPGIRMRLKAMHYFTARLPHVDAVDTQSLFGQSTLTAIQNGGVRGALYEIKGVIEATIAKYDALNIILTGGDANFFESWTNFRIFAAPDLVIEGLNEILKYNVE